ncbi:DUF262 domain-containing protein [Salmonella enterica subsp. enterica]
MNNAELNTSAVKIDKLINRINNGEIKIPAFQRGYVWKQNQIIELLESVKKQYPIGSILLWEASQKEKLRSTRNIAGYIIPDKGENWPVNYVLDGQQRLSSIYAVFSDKIEQDNSNQNYNPNIDIFEIYYSFKTEAFLPKSELTQDNHKNTVLLRNIVDPVKVFDEILALSEEYRTKAKTLSSIFLNYEIPVIEIKNRTKEEVGVIFERINNTGTKLNTLDLMTAWTWTEDFHLLEEIKSLSDDLDEKGFGKLDPKLILQIISGMIIGSTRTENILSLSAEAVRDSWDKIREAIMKTIDFLYTHIRCAHLDFLPYHQQLVSLSRFFYTSKRINAEQADILVKFFWRTSFSNRYSTGQTTDKMDIDIAFIDELVKGQQVSLTRYNISVTEKELTSTQFSKSNPLTRAFLLLSGLLHPKDLTNGITIDIDNALSSFNRKQYHHIFPNAYLKKHIIPKEKRFSLINFCFLPADSNKKISSKEPSDYFFNIVPNNKYQEILESNMLPIDISIYADNNFDKFIFERSLVVMNKILSLI